MNLMQGDCLIAMKEIANGSVDMVLTDPPYGTTACKWDLIIPLEPMWEQLRRVIKPNGAIVMTASQPFTTTLIASNMKMFKYCWVWNKEICGAFALAKKRPMIVTEDICVFAVKGHKYIPIMTEAKKKNIRPVNKGSSCSEATPVSSGVARSDKNYNPKKRYPKNILTYSKYGAECNQVNRVHPTQKPVALMEYLIKTYTNEGETVLDFTMGSGTTGVACANLNRYFIGIEKDLDYFSIALERIEKAHKDNAQAQWEFEAVKSNSLLGRNDLPNKQNKQNETIN